MRSSPAIKHQEIVDEGFSNYIAVFIDKDFFNKALKEYGVKVDIKLEGGGSFFKRMRIFYTYQNY